MIANTVRVIVKWEPSNAAEVPMSFGGTTPPVIRHLLLCQHIGYDTDTPTAPYSLHGLVTALVPEPGDPFPLLLPELWVFFQAFGDPGEYQIWIDLAPVDEDAKPLAKKRPTARVSSSFTRTRISRVEVGSY